MKKKKIKKIQKEKEIVIEIIKNEYSEKIKEMNNEKLRYVFGIFILNMKKKTLKTNFLKDKNTLDKIKNHTEEKLNKEFNMKEDEMKKYLSLENDKIAKIKGFYECNINNLMKIALRMNEQNDKLNNSDISTELFNIIGELNHFSTDDE